jgi:ribose-phosphate pyrophosphokinase
MNLGLKAPNFDYLCASLFLTIINVGVKIFAGRASKDLASSIASHYGNPLGDVKVTVFSDGEFQPSFEETVRGQDVFIVQSTMPPTENLFELLLKFCNFCIC